MQISGSCFPHCRVVVLCSGTLCDPKCAFQGIRTVSSLPHNWQSQIFSSPHQLHLPWPPFPTTPSKSISVPIRKDYAKILRGITLGRHSHLLTPPHRILGHSTLCSLSAYQLLQCSVQSIRQSCFTTTVTPSLPGTCGRSPWARDRET